MREYKEKRSCRRYEPALFDVEIKDENNNKMRGSILDISKGGLAAALSEDIKLPKISKKVDLSAIALTPDKSEMTIGKAEVLRTWSEEERLFDNGQGIALVFDEAIADRNISGRLLRGNDQQTRLESQSVLAVSDMNHLGSYRRDLIGCQMKLFSLTLTVGVALAGAYFALAYHGIVTNMLDNPDLSFWRTMVAALPGCLAVACALMVAQKSISIQRIDSYLAVLKECLIRDQYPREFKGWETDYRKFRHIVNTEVCQNCKLLRKCGTLKDEDQEQLKRRKMLSGPKIDLYHIVMYMSFFSAFVLSTFAVGMELLKFSWEKTLYMAIGFSLALLFSSVSIGLLFVFYRLRKGKYSINSFKRCWIDILNRCRQPV